jgi:hypothetical protein
MAPRIDLQTGRLSRDDRGADIDLFPSNHSAGQDGTVQLIKVSA